MDQKMVPGGRSPEDRAVPLPIRRAMRRIGEDLATWRKLRGLTQKQLADRAGVSHTTLHVLERGGGGVSLETLLRALRALGILDTSIQALDPYESDIGRLRSAEQLPKRVRPRSLGGSDEKS